MWMRDMPRAKTRPPRARVAISGVIELSSSARRAARAAPVRSGRPTGHGAPRVADRVDDGGDGVLEAVAVGRDDPGVRGRAGAARPAGCCPARRAGAAPTRIASASAPSGSRPRSSVRRRARSSTEASRKSLRSASGSTTVPMSRPAMTIAAVAARSRAGARAAPRAPRGPRRPPTPPRRRRGRGPRRCGRRRRPGPARAGRRASGDERRPRRRARRRSTGSSTATPRSSASHVTARYSRPVSQKR